MEILRVQIVTRSTGAKYKKQQPIFVVSVSYLIMLIIILLKLIKILLKIL